MVTIQLINAIAQNEEKLKSPTKIDKTMAALKDPKTHFPLFNLTLPLYPALTLSVLIGFTSDLVFSGFYCLLC
jgi:hypothetical protein